MLEKDKPGTAVLCGPYILVLSGAYNSLLGDAVNRYPWKPSLSQYLPM